MNGYSPQKRQLLNIAIPFTIALIFSLIVTTVNAGELPAALIIIPLALRLIPFTRYTTAALIGRHLHVSAPSAPGTPL